MAERRGLEALQVLGLGGLALRTLGGPLEAESYRNWRRGTGALFPQPQPVHTGPPAGVQARHRPPWAWGRQRGAISRPGLLICTPVPAGPQTVPQGKSVQQSAT